MSLKQQIDTDLKAAMLAGDKPLVMTLRGLKSTILYAEVAFGVRDKGLSDDETLEVLSKEAKKRQESIDLYNQVGKKEQADTEAKEKKFIEKYLPTPLSETEIAAQIDAVISDMGDVNASQMGQIIGAVKSKTTGRADGAVIARLTKERLKV